MNDEDRHRDGNEAHEKPGHDLSSSASSTKRMFRRLSPGIMVFSQKRHQGQMNRRGLELTGHLDQTGTEPIMMTLSRVVGELRVQVQDNLDNRRKADLWGIIELRRVMVDAGRQILLRGFGLPNRNSQNDSRIVIVLEERSLPQERCETGRQVGGLFQERRGGGGQGISQAGSQSRGV